MERRQFIQSLCAGVCGVAAVGLLPATGQSQEERFLHPARYFEQLPDKRVRCLLCPRKCVVAPGGRGYCRVRENVDGSYHSAVYGRVCTFHVDPIEKKPLFHFLPGTTAYSIATVGCNMACKFCQNWEISQESPENVRAIWMPPDKLASAAKAQGCPTIAYTYTEPIVFFEYVLDSLREGHERGIRSVMISAGYINHDPLVELAAEMDAIKIDLKAYNDEYYRDICATSLEPVLETLLTIKKAGTWLEIVNLVIPTLNDSDKDIDQLSKWVIENLGDEVPVHFTRFYPTYKLGNLPPTPLASVEKARQIALARGLKYAYVGNVPVGHPGESTYCPKCGQVVVERAGYRVLSVDLENGRCKKCGTPIPGVWT